MTLQKKRNKSIKKVCTCCLCVLLMTLIFSACSVQVVDLESTEPTDQPSSQYADLENDIETIVGENKEVECFKEENWKEAGRLKEFNTSFKNKVIDFYKSFYLTENALYITSSFGNKIPKRFELAVPAKQILYAEGGSNKGFIVIENQNTTWTFFDSNVSTEVDSIGDGYLHRNGTKELFCMQNIKPFSDDIFLSAYRAGKNIIFNFANRYSYELNQYIISLKTGIAQKVQVPYITTGGILSEPIRNINEPDSFYTENFPAIITQSGKAFFPRLNKNLSYKPFVADNIRKIYKPAEGKFEYNVIFSKQDINIALFQKRLTGKKAPKYKTVQIPMIGGYTTDDIKHLHYQPAIENILIEYNDGNIYFYLEHYSKFYTKQLLNELNQNGHLLRINMYQDDVYMLFDNGIVYRYGQLSKPKI